MGLLRGTREQRRERRKREKPEPDWRDILWRQWLHSSDRRVALRIFSHLADEPARWEARGTIVAALAALGACALAICVVVMRALWTPDDLRYPGVPPSWWTALTAGGLAGALLGLLYAAGSRGWRRALLVLHRLPKVAATHLGLAPSTAILSLPASISCSVADLNALLFLGQGAVAPICGLWMALAAWALALRSSTWEDASIRPAPRWLLWWWKGRPTQQELDWVVRHPDAPAWVASALAPPDEPLSMRELVEDLLAGSQPQQKRAEKLLSQLKSESIEPLLRISSHTRVALIAQRIARKTLPKTHMPARSRLCARCVCWVEYIVARKGLLPVTYCACRSCHGGRQYVEHRGRVVAALDGDGDWKFRRRSGALLVNWTARARNEGFEGSGAFDFDRVEILRATDEEVRHFLVDVQNDTDEKRRKGYRKMVCTVAPDCALSEGTLRQLRATFGEVTTHGGS